MIVVYTQDGTYFCKDENEAKDILVSTYGDKLGTEAYNFVSRAPLGRAYRKNGGPLVRSVTKEQAEKIREKEKAIGMMM